MESRREMVLTPPSSQGVSHRREFGPADNADIFAALFSLLQVNVPTTPLQPSVLHNLDIPPFSKDVTQQHEWSLDGLVVATYICNMRAQEPVMRRQQVILEIVAPSLPEEQILPQAEAVAELNALLADTDVLRSQEWFMNGVSDLIQLTPDGAGDDHVYRRWAQDTDSWCPEVTLAQKLEYLVEIAKNADDCQRNRCVYPVLSTTLSWALHGQISQTSLDHIVTDLQRTTPHIAEAITSVDFVATWHYFGHLWNDGNVVAVMRQLLSFIHGPYCQLRMLMAQTTGSLIGHLDVIARAVHNHPDFPWHLIMRLFPKEWDNAMYALKVGGGNPFFGFVYEDKLVNCRIKRVAWLCGRLLFAMGDKHLWGFSGNDFRGVYNKKVQGLIDAYRNTHNPDPSPIKLSRGSSP